ncbi:hypothetical protein SAMN05216327_10498 [Dyadobacter sp. SG02]|uniref:hypothetical protein n=1 Tax=Dyadobacter sp. SG02 TaxID=1855291 RepID=UPI0008C1D327|nr:hypothetical protein [Dyadobacter sp. SG02]SEI82193.1 hypothetical protein SAMN05216327_10498 [Dyadobacter sp. SG02]
MKFEESILTKTIYYVDASILATIDADFNFIEGAGWYELYQYNYDQSFWRLDRFDKLQEQFFVKLPFTDDWANYNSQEMEIELLRKTRGATTTPCVWQECGKPSLMGLAFCERHAYFEMGIRK